MSVYRQHGGGIWAGTPPEQRARTMRGSIELCRRLNADLDHRYTPIVWRTTAVLWLKIGVQRAAPRLVDPLVSMRYWLSSVRDRINGSGPPGPGPLEPPADA